MLSFSDFKKFYDPVTWKDTYNICLYNFLIKPNAVIKTFAKKII